MNLLPVSGQFFSTSVWTDLGVKPEIRYVNDLNECHRGSSGRVEWVFKVEV